MSATRPEDQHLTSDEAFAFIENSLNSRQLREVDDHLDACLECVAYLAEVVRTERPTTPEDEDALSAVPEKTPEEILDRLRAPIDASSPSLDRRPGIQWNWGRWAPAAIAVVVLFGGFAWLQSYVIEPARGQELAATAMENLISLRQGTGRVPLRYIPELERARVTRSGFDTVHPAEAAVETQLRHAAELAPNDVETHLALGLFLLDKGTLNEAQQHIERAMAIDPDSILATNGMAVIHYERSIRDPSRAKDFLRKGIALLRDAKRRSPNDLQVVFNLAMLYQAAGSSEIAKGYWKAYVELDPDSEWGEVAAEKLDDLDH